MTTTTKFKARSDATDFLRERGVPTGKKRLADLTTEDEGPKYVVINGPALYTGQDCE